jgi:hypothetical protein
MIHLPFLRRQAQAAALCLRPVGAQAAAKSALHLLPRRLIPGVVGAAKREVGRTLLLQAVPGARLHGLARELLLDHVDELERGRILGIVPGAIVDLIAAVPDRLQWTRGGRDEPDSFARW